MRERAPALAMLLGALVVVGIVIAWPLSQATYPPMTDLPMHAAHVGAFRHWFDADYHFREQFRLVPLEVPYLSLYVLGALLDLVLPVTTATKIAAGLHLALVPLGVGTLTWGMKKSPLWGLAALPLVWGALTHWGFLNFVGALGLFAASLGLAFRQLEAPSRGRAAALGAALCLLLVMHPFRFPFAVLAVTLAGVTAYPVTRTLRPLASPLGAALALFTLFWLGRGQALSTPLGSALGFAPGRLREAPGYLVDGFADPAEAATALRHVEVVGIVAIVSAIVLWLGRGEATPGATDGEAAPSSAAPAPPSDARARGRRLVIAAHVTVALSLVGLLVGYLALPMELGVWWYVYPREATAVALLVPALLPDLPRETWLRALLAGALGTSSVSAAQVVARNYAAFDETTRDFATITAALPQAPKLLYLVVDHGGSTRTQTPYIHLPAWVQAEKGGWLSFHFAVFGASPLRYRDAGEPGAVVPPPVPVRWEWTPDAFRVREHGAFFDWFLVRDGRDPARLFRGDPSIVRVGREGRWWLYRRRALPPPQPDAPRAPPAHLP